MLARHNRFVGNSDQRTELLRILLADDDDLHAFTLQCVINRLPKPCAFVRVYDREVLPRKIRAFEPELLVFSGRFAAAGEVRQIKQHTNGTPIICLVKTAEEAEASLSAGATDCLLSSQEQSLSECIEKHLNGKFAEPYFRVEEKHSTKGRLTKTEEKLEQLDRRIAAWLRNLAKTTQLQWSRLKVATKIGCNAGSRVDPQAVSRRACEILCCASNSVLCKRKEPWKRISRKQKFRRGSFR